MLPNLIFKQDFWEGPKLKVKHLFGQETWKYYNTNQCTIYFSISYASTRDDQRWCKLQVMTSALGTSTQNNLNDHPAGVCL